MRKLLLALLLASPALAEIAPQTGSSGTGATVNVSGGGTGVTSITDNALIYGSGTSPVDELPVLGNGGLVIGTGGAPSTGTIAVSAALSVANAAGSITLSVDSSSVTVKSGGLVINSELDSSSVTKQGFVTLSNLSGTAATATALAVDPADADSGYVCRGINTTGVCQPAFVEDASTNGSTNPVTSNTLFDGLALKQDLDADLTDLADGSLTGSKVGDGVPAANIAAGSLDSDVIASSVAAVLVAGTCGDATTSCRTTFGADGRIRSVSSTTISGGDAVLSATQTFSGNNTFTSTATFTAMVKFGTGGTDVNGAWNDWTPTYGGFSANPTVSQARYFQLGKLVIASIEHSAGGTSNATNHTVSLPVAAKYGGATSAGLAICVDNGVVITLTTPRIDFSDGSETATLYKDANAAAWTGTGSKYCNFTVVYEAN